MLYDTQPKTLFETNSIERGYLELIRYTIGFRETISAQLFSVKLGIKIS